MSANPVAATKKPTSKAAPKKAETVTLKLAFEHLAEAHALSKKQAHAMMEDMVSFVTTHLKQGDRFQMRGLGILEVKDRPARSGRNPSTGAVMQIAASKKVAFRAAKELKEAI
jgi:DNA-binding protein HU-beta